VVPGEEQVINWFDVSTRDVLLVDLAGGRGRDIEEFHQRFPDTHGRLILEELHHVLKRYLWALLLSGLSLIF
jgi:hypothetical protein